MPYENEESSLIASAKFNKQILNEPQFHSQFKFDNKNQQKLAFGLLYLWDKQNIIKNLETDKNDIYRNLQCIDGSLVTNFEEHGAEYINMQFGSAFLEIEKLFQIERDKKGNVNPYQVAQIYDSPNHVLFGTKFPSKNVYFNKNGQILTLKDSFIETMNYLFTQSQPIVDSFLEDLKRIGKSPNAHKFNNIDNIKAIFNEIREESIIYSTQKEVQKIMLISEVMLSQYLLKNNLSDSDLVVLDGRLHNQDIGEYIKEINPSIVNSNSMLVGVQKTGILNIILSEIHNILKNKKSNHKNLKNLFDRYEEGKSIFFILDRDFKGICGIPEYKVGNYGRECFYITEAPKRQEFVFTLPEHLFPDANDAQYIIKLEKLTQSIFNKISAIFEYAHTDLYLGNKGVLLANVLAHSHVSLNQIFTNIPSNRLNTINQTEIKKPKI